jgi:hypothetical protein
VPRNFLMGRAEVYGQPGLAISTGRTGNAQCRWMLSLPEKLYLGRVVADGPQPLSTCPAPRGTKGLVDPQQTLLTRIR